MATRLDKLIVAGSCVVALGFVSLGVAVASRLNKMVDEANTLAKENNKITENALVDSCEGVLDNSAYLTLWENRKTYEWSHRALVGNDTTDPVVDLSSSSALREALYEVTGVRYPIDRQLPRSGIDACLNAAEILSTKENRSTYAKKLNDLLEKK